ncbi:MAG TPA: sigma-70 family RNA polymerase sigma factor [Blastocatellia bacterium]|nr:sigma-70 family RNA polymerase sigma factor [Blastocatellia bacterium]
MTGDEQNLWQRYSQGDQAARKELILHYLPLVDLLAKRIARIAGANWEDLRQDGSIGLMKAISRFDPGRGVPFKYFARPYICGAIYDSSEITRDMARRQDEIYRKVRRTEEELTKRLQRNPTVEEVAENAGLTIEQILNAVDARGLAFAASFPDAEDPPARVIEAPQPERAILLLEVLAHLPDRDREIIRLYYWEDRPHEEIARETGLSVSNVIKIRQRALVKLRQRLDVKRKGGRDED